MKPDIHPSYQPVVFGDASSGTEFLTRSTVTSTSTVQCSDRNGYPLVTVDIRRLRIRSGPGTGGWSTRGQGAAFRAQVRPLFTSPVSC